MRIYDRQKTYELLVTLQLIKGIYEVIVASDEKFLLENEIKNSTAGTGKREKDKESGVARGIDFQFVSNVINFDFPVDTDSYIHRVGRTARGKNKGKSFNITWARVWTSRASGRKAMQTRFRTVAMN